jgi:hypothetical protein
MPPLNSNPEAAEREAKAAVEIDSTQVAAYAVLVRLYARRGQWVELEAALGTAERQVPDDLAPYYRAAEELLGANRSADRASHYLQKYLGVEPEGNEPTRADTLRKLAVAGAGPRTEHAVIEASPR